jgi:hypothetical protein
LSISATGPFFGAGRTDLGVDSCKRPQKRSKTLPLNVFFEKRSRQILGAVFMAFLAAEQRPSKGKGVSAGSRGVRYTGIRGAETPAVLQPLHGINVAFQLLLNTRLSS